MDENHSPAPEISPAPPVPAENPPAPVPAAPPAATLATRGEVQDERVRALEQRLTEEQNARKKAEVIAAEKEAENQRLKEIPAAPKPKAKAKRWYMPVIGADDED